MSFLSFAQAKEELLFVQGERIKKTVELNGTHYVMNTEKMDISFKIRGISYSNKIEHQIFKAKIEGTDRYILEIQSFVPNKQLEHINLKLLSDLLLEAIIDEKQVGTLGFGIAYDEKYKSAFNRIYTKLFRSNSIFQMK